MGVPPSVFPPECLDASLSRILTLSHCFSGSNPRCAIGAHVSTELKVKVADLLYDHLRTLLRWGAFADVDRLTESRMVIVGSDGERLEVHVKIVQAK